MKYKSSEGIISNTKYDVCGYVWFQSTANSNIWYVEVDGVTLSAISIYDTYLISTFVYSYYKLMTNNVNVTATYYSYQ